MTALLKIFGLPGTIALFAAVSLAAAVVWLAVDLHTTEARLAVAKATATAAKGRADANASSAASWKTVSDVRHDLLVQCQAENTRISAETAAGLAQAEAARVDAERTLAAFTERYAAALRIPACAAARRNLDAACPAMEY